jgi:DNA-binding GntR family transcriptional regulator
VPRTPIYRTIVSDIRAKVAAGELKSGDKLPSIAELAAQYECGETAVKQALGILTELGITEGHQGRGTFVL